MTIRKNHGFVWMVAPILVLSVLSDLIAQTPPEQIFLKDYRPKSVYKVPQSNVAKAKYPVIDMHSHPYAKSPADIARWVDTMDAVPPSSGQSKP